MHLIDTGSNDPWFNLATEEFLFKNFPDDLIMLYINSPSVIIGKHQNAYEEINYRFVNEHKLPVIRRISGGGTVYHDSGNLNFTFMKRVEAGKQVDFKRFIEPIAGFLKEFGVKPEIGDKNEVRSLGLKFSGNAEHLFRNRLLHHGTILFSSDLDNLRSALKKGEAKFVSRSVQSNRTSVGNLLGQMESIENTNSLKNSLMEYMRSYYPGSVNRIIGDDEKAGIERLIVEKYGTWDWNFAYGPEYEFHNFLNISGITFKVALRVKKGIIVESLIADNDYIHPLSAQLIGLPHRYEEIVRLVRQNETEIKESDLYRLFG